ncbi:hypothetical protein QYM36_002557, partial [Artemia franciscana]
MLKTPDEDGSESMGPVDRPGTLEESYDGANCQTLSSQPAKDPSRSRSIPPLENTLDQQADSYESANTHMTEPMLPMQGALETKVEASGPTLAEENYRRGGTVTHSGHQGRILARLSPDINPQYNQKQAETRFIDAQEKRRSVQMALNSIQEKLKDIHLELDRTPRGDDRYLKLITQEHSIIREERKLRDEGLLYEKSERDNFSALSNAVRDSHERERAQGERTKYWSIMGSILGTVVGLFGSSAINRMRMKEIKELVVEAAGSRNDLTLQLHDIVQ